MMGGPHGPPPITDGSKKPMSNRVKEKRYKRLLRFKFAKDFGKSYMKVRPFLVRHLLRTVKTGKIETNLAETPSFIF